MNCCQASVLTVGRGDQACQLPLHMWSFCDRTHGFSTSWLYHAALSITIHCADAQLHLLGAWGVWLLRADNSIMTVKRGHAVSRRLVRTSIAGRLRAGVGTSLRQLCAVLFCKA